MSIYTDLLFLGGHVVNVDLARSLASADASAPAREAAEASTPSQTEAPVPAEAAASYQPRSWRYPMRLFGALVSMDESPAETVGRRTDDHRFEPTYGNRQAWRRRFPAYGSSGQAMPLSSCGACPA